MIGSATVCRGVIGWRLVLILAVMVLVTGRVHQARACGGFFCQLVPINQAAEQIIFRQDGDRVTAVVLIQYVGEASDFSWVVPVPANLDSTEALSTGSDVLFQSLELATRPQFVLEIQGQACPEDGQAVFDSAVGGPAPEDGTRDDGVTVVDSGAVGPFDVLVITSDDPDALATWLTDNDYDLSERGPELIAPYVEEGMNFVALKLQQDKGVGDIQPLIMRYQAEHAMIPIRLTAVAAEDDMGVLVWMLGSGRAIPLNYLHVVPNYTLLNWYQGTFAAYASYQNLITAAMNEAGGRGFATDYAATLDDDLRGRLPNLEDYNQSLDLLESAGTAQQFYEVLIRGTVLPADQLLEIMRRQVPLPQGIDEFVYNDPATLIEAVGLETAEAARSSILDEIVAGIIDPLQATLEVFDGDLYMTRLFTTLSADEMTVDPEFSFNRDLEDQALERRATLFVECGALSGTSWRLELGPGTGRDGETVLEGTGSPPFVTPVIEQPNVLRAEFLSESAPADVQIDNSGAVGVVRIDGEGGGFRICGAGSAGCGGLGLLTLTGLLVGVRWMRFAGRGVKGIQ